MARIYFFYDFTSPASYLAAREICDLSRAQNVAVEWAPVVSSEFIKLALRDPAATLRTRCHGFRYDVKRWADLLGVPFKMAYPTTFDPRPALRAAQGLPQYERVTLTIAIFAALWQGRVQPDRADWVAEICRQASLPETWATPANDATIDLQLRHNTEEAFAAGIFSVPAFLLDNGLRRQPFRGLEQFDLLRWTVEQETTAERPALDEAIEPVPFAP